MFVRPVLLSLLAANLLWLGGGRAGFAQTRDDFDRARRHMVSAFLEKEGIHDPRVLEAMRTVPRHEFMPNALRRKSYEDAAFLIGFKQTISPPFVVAYMTEAIEPRPSDRVLEIGTGSGYQAAVLSGLVKEVYSIEIVEQLGKTAERRLKRLGYGNVKTKVGDGYLGWSQYAPFDKIIVTCSPENVPAPLLEQLKEGGRMVIPLGERYHQDVYLLEKKKGQLVRKQLIPTLFVPMTGRSEKERTLRPDPRHPHVNNGGFEEQEADGSPAGWHYQRQVTLVQDGAPEGRFYARFDNEDRGRMSQALQGMAVDGRQIETLRISLKIRCDHIADGPELYNKADLQVYFYDEHRRTMGEAIGPHWLGSSGWETANITLAVPQGAREAILRIGLNGATGRLSVDDVKLTAERR